MDHVHCGTFILGKKEMCKEPIAKSTVSLFYKGIYPGRRGLVSSKEHHTRDIEHEGAVFVVIVDKT